MNRVIGTYITNSLSSESFRSFVPKPLPPDPPLKLSDEHYDLLDKATLALGRLDGLTSTGQLSREVVSLYKASILNNIETHITTCCNALELKVIGRAGCTFFSRASTRLPTRLF